MLGRDIREHEWLAVLHEVRPRHVRFFHHQRILSALPGRLFRQHHRLTQLHCVPDRCVLKHHRSCGVHLLPRWDVRRCFECFIVPALPARFLLWHYRAYELSRVPSRHLLLNGRSVAVHSMPEGRLHKIHKQHFVHNVLPHPRRLVTLAVRLHRSDTFRLSLSVCLPNTCTLIMVKTRVAVCFGSTLPHSFALRVCLTQEFVLIYIDHSDEF